MSSGKFVQKLDVIKLLMSLLSRVTSRLHDCVEFQRLAAEFSLLHFQARLPRFTHAHKNRHSSELLSMCRTLYCTWPDH
jgi:hypothetical protein